MLKETKNKFINEIMDGLNNSSLDPLLYIDDVNQKLGDVGELELMLDEDLGEMCNTVYTSIMSKYGEDSFNAEFNRKYPDGCLLTKIATIYSSNRLKKLSEEAMEYVTDDFIARCEGTYDYFDSKGKGLCAFLVGKNGDVLKLLLDLGTSEDNAEQFTQGMAMISVYKGSCIIRCEETKELYMFAANDESVYSVPKILLADYIKSSGEHLKGFKAREFLMTAVNVPQGDLRA